MKQKKSQQPREPRIWELFGFDPFDQTEISVEYRRSFACPFVPGKCIKRINRTVIAGVCSLKLPQSEPVICCPQRLYANEYTVLKDIAMRAFGANCVLVNGLNVKDTVVESPQKKIAVFGKKWGKELRLPSRQKRGSYSVDWILAKLDVEDKLLEFVAVEIQSIDTTGSYASEQESLMSGSTEPPSITVNLNWENVNKRILPQLITKGHILRRERLCKSGMFFVSPSPVYQRIRSRLGGQILEYTMQSGALTFVWYDIGSKSVGKPAELSLAGTFTTTFDQVATAFLSPTDLPEQNVYEKAIIEAL